MEREMEYLLALLKDYLWERPARAAEGVDWARLRELASIHSVGGILGCMVENGYACKVDYEPVFSYQRGARISGG